jgi:hypothetical protein
VYALAVLVPDAEIVVTVHTGRTQSQSVGPVCLHIVDKVVYLFGHGVLILLLGFLGDSVQLHACLAYLIVVILGIHNALILDVVYNVLILAQVAGVAVG